MADYSIESIEFDIYNGNNGWDGWEQPNSDKTCRCCGRTDLHWDERNGQWRLFDNRGIHVCKINPLNLNSP